MSLSRLISVGVRDGGLDELYFRLISPPGFVSLDGKCCVDYTQIIITGKLLSNLLGLIAGVNTLHRYSAQSCVEHHRSMKWIFLYRYNFSITWIHSHCNFLVINYFLTYPLKIRGCMIRFL